ncbi:replicative DNA helicase [Curtobacterium flaccumfaciens]|uniref:replicative DNA helicase n=1 Tax=Curtobacterium flaccumfaciens TaxID=2035 RepID=UPI001BDF267D|nr:DnaB-like helicase C-terminal domain-containing protein [Curtobacterium flaccumfaciens]MBT1630432.1 AAA family ATPase [Curtobacterium flaccumfaciens pv. oortii]MCX2843912.1 AAA family ATPase [Curtobacterium flaccumfaciens pv. oortii]
MIDNEIPYAELAVIGAVMHTYGKALDRIALAGRDFEDARHGAFFDLMRERHDRGEPVDHITMSVLPKMDPLFIDRAFEAGWSHAVVTTHAETVATAALRRRLVAVGSRLQQLGGASEATEAELRERAYGFLDAAMGSAVSQVTYLADIVEETVQYMTEQQQFIPTPWPRLNEMIGGLRPGALYVFGARPGVGKTVVAQNLAQTLAQHGGVAFSSLEMGRYELHQRFIAANSDITLYRMKNGRVTDRDVQTIRTNVKRVSPHVAIDDRSSVGLAEIRQHARQVQHDGGLSGIVVDYLQLMEGTSGSPRHEVVAAFSRGLKVLARDLHVPVIALSQLNRNSESSLSGEPKLSDLRESGAIEQDADLVVLLHRERDAQTKQLDNFHITFDVAKNRHGETGHVTLDWDGTHSRVTDPTARPMQGAAA